MCSFFHSQPPLGAYPNSQDLLEMYFWTGPPIEPGASRGGEASQVGEFGTQEGMGKHIAEVLEK